MLPILIFIVLFNAAASEYSNTVGQCIAKYPRNCAEALSSGGQSGIYKIQIPSSQLEPFYVYCQLDPNGDTAWTVIHRRIDAWIDFDRNWENYELGFGQLEGDHFIGLKKLHALTNDDINELWIDLEDFEGEKRFAKYASFAISDEKQNYTLFSVGHYTGDAGDSLWYNAGEQFSTKDRGNMNDDCAALFSGGWWYKYCTYCNLNGKYLFEANMDSFGEGLTWNSWKGPLHVLKYAQMAIRPRVT